MWCCIFISVLLAQYEYEVDVELNVTDFETVDNLMRLLSRGHSSLALGPTVTVTHTDITTGEKEVSAGWTQWELILAAFQ